MFFKIASSNNSIYYPKSSIVNSTGSANKAISNIWDRKYTPAGKTSAQPVQQQKIPKKETPLTKTESYDVDGNLQYIYKDKDGRIVRVVNHDSSSEEYSYNADGDVVTKKNFNSKGELNTLYEYSYDKENKTQTSIKKDKNNNVIAQSKLHFSDSGQKIKEVIYDSDGNEVYYSEPVYDEKGEIIMENVYFPDGTEMSTKEYFETVARLNKLIK